MILSFILLNSLKKQLLEIYNQNSHTSHAATTQFHEPFFTRGDTTLLETQMFSEL